MTGNEITLKERKAKVAFCKCEKGIFLMSALPYAETNKSSVREFAKYARQGYRIDYLDLDKAKELFYKCDCYKND